MRKMRKSQANSRHVSEQNVRTASVGKRVRETAAKKECRTDFLANLRNAGYWQETGERLFQTAHDPVV
jgi:hypothetical protein